jgi:biotin carboxyl carrier protein
MKLRIQVEGRAYDVDVDVVDGAPEANELPRVPEAPIPPAVLRPRPPQKLPEDSVCRSPIAGRVAAVIAAEGRTVGRNEPVVLIEAMKMEVPIGPAVEGTVKVIRVAAGEAVSAGQVLFELA